MSKSLPVLIDTTNAQSKTTALTTPIPPASSTSSSSSSLSPKFTPKHVISKFDQLHPTAKQPAEKSETIFKPQYGATSAETTKQPIIEYTTNSYTNNHHNPYNNNNNDERHRDSTQDSVRSTTPPLSLPPQKKHNYEITTKSYSIQQFILPDNQINDVFVNSPNDKRLDDTQITYQTSAKLTKTMQLDQQHHQLLQQQRHHHYQGPSNARNAHPISRSAFYACSVLIVIVILVISLVLSIRKRRKLDAHCDKTNLISNSASTTSINDCEMDFNHDTSTCIAYTTIIHV